MIRLGVLVPFSNTILEPDLAQLMPPGVSIHPARLGGYDLDAVPDSAQMAGLGAADLDEPLRLVAGVRPHMVLYGCTSATLAHGIAFDVELAAQVQDRIGVPSVTAAGSVVMALRTLGVRQIGFASPYVAELNDRAVAFLSDAGFATVSRADVGRTLGNDEQCALTPEEIMALGRQADSSAAEAIVLSCTDMRSVEALEPLEAALGKPVITSNQAMAYAVLSTLGLGSGAVGGRLLSRLSARTAPGADRR
ncbi:MAG: aspartate/glutamate racemase family protein [Pseudomonadota bacterium]